MATATLAHLDSDLFKEYLDLRAIATAFQNRIVTVTSRRLLESCGRRIGLECRPNSLSETEATVVMDASIYSFRLAGKTSVEKYFERNPQVAGSRNEVVQAAMLSSRYHVVEVIQLLPPYGIIVRDLFSGEHLQMADRAMSMTAHVGLLMLTRLLQFPNYVMTTGAAMAIGLESEGDFVEARRWMGQVAAGKSPASCVSPHFQQSPEQHSEWTLSVIHEAIALRLADGIAYHSPR